MDDNKIPRSEYPRPQFIRKDWLNLNGEWDFEFDFGKSGKDRKWQENAEFSKKIVVPFCPESKLSGIEYKDFMNMVWYKRSFKLPKEWEGKRCLLHFGAVDYQADVWINGKHAGSHRGGYTSFTFDITLLTDQEENTIVVCAKDETRAPLQARGKQCGNYFSGGCDYTRTTGIWQTVWLESVSMNYIKDVKYYPNCAEGNLTVEASFVLDTKSYAFEAQAYFNGELMGERHTEIMGERVLITVPLKDKYLWEPGSPNLYDLTLKLVDGEQTADQAESYFGLREVSFHDGVIRINNKPIYQRLVLDQGFYPDGIYTAPDDEALKKDIEISMGLGFNGARLHQKVFEPRYLYWADKLGYLVWGEYGSWGLDVTGPEALELFLPEWMESVERDFNCPSIIGWCPMNETWDKSWRWEPDGYHRYGTRQDDEVLRVVYQVTKAMDRTRPVIDTSGNFHVVTDIFDIHDYEQDVEKFREHFGEMGTGGETYVTFKDRQKYDGQPYFVSEYGGIWWDENPEGGWGYGSRPASKEEFIERYKGLTEILLGNKKICAFCYTQLYDVEQEVNGLYTYQRVSKFEPEIIKKINQQPAAIEM